LKNKAFILPIIFFVVVVIFYFTKHQSIPKIAKVGSLAPDIELTDAQDNKLKLSELKGNVVFINFWASWCQPCIDEIPSIEVLYRYLSGNTNFKMITILFQDDENRVSRYMKQQGYTFPIYRNFDGSAAKQFGITGVPETFIIDKKGILRDKVVGPLEWDTQPVIQSFLNLINE
jgi:peroxiredoxin